MNRTREGGKTKGLHQNKGVAATTIIPDLFFGIKSSGTLWPVDHAHAYKSKRCLCFMRNLKLYLCMDCSRERNQERFRLLDFLACLATLRGADFWQVTLSGAWQT